MLPFYEAGIEIAPALIKARKSATYAVRLVNQGNVTSHFTLNGRDEQGNLTLQFEGGSATRSNLGVEPGETGSTKLAVSAQLRWFGSPVSHNFTVDTELQEGRERKSANARFIHYALLPRWALAALLVVLVALGWLANYLLKPETQKMEPATAVAGQTVTMHL